MSNLFKELNFDRVIKTEDPEQHQMDSSFLEVKRYMTAANKNPDEATLLYVYYSGHGVLDNTTKIVLNEGENEMRYFDLEQKLSILSKYKHCFVAAIFDCCREEIPKEETRSIGDSDHTATLTD
jgi:hypothetical protein